ncbi:MAG TPA: hypothetical protein VF157_06205 [Chloroflexota bacterium]
MTPEQIAAKLAEHSRRLDRLEGVAQERRERGWVKPLAASVGTIVLLAGVVLAGRALLASPDSRGGAVNGGASQLLYADDFSDPAKGVFPAQQAGTARLPEDGVTAPWSYSYEDGALVARVGPPSGPLSRRVIGGSARAPNRLTGDFAVEVRARASASAASAVYGVRYFPGDREFGFGLQPGQGSYAAWELFKPPLATGQSKAIARDQEENWLRLEVRDSGARLLVNGRMLDSLRQDAFGLRPASVGLFFDAVGAPSDGAVEIRYTDFRVYSLS